MSIFIKYGVMAQVGIEADDITQTNGTLKIDAVYSTTIDQTNGTLKIE